MQPEKRKPDRADGRVSVGMSKGWDRIDNQNHTALERIVQENSGNRAGLSRKSGPIALDRIEAAP